jgi:hypothetical protein
MRTRCYYRGPTYDINNPTKLPKSLLAPINDTEDDENELDDDDEGAQAGKEKNKLKALTEAEQERAAAMHEVGHACVATALGCEVIDIRFSTWKGGGLTRVNYDKASLSIADRVTCLVAGGVAERMVNGSGGDRDDLIDCRQLGASDEQIGRAQARAAEMLRANWRGVCNVADALQRWPLLRGGVVREMLEAARKPVSEVHRVSEDIATKEFEVVRIRDGKRKRVGKTVLVAGFWHAYRGHQNDYVGRFGDYLTAGRAI